LKPNMSISAPPGILLDYSVLGRLQNIDSGTYNGRNAEALKRLRDWAISKKIAVWMSKITEIEMVQGLENPNLSPSALEKAKQNDEGKCIMANSMHIQWLTYPASQLNDEYSRLGLTFMLCGDLDLWKRAKILEERFLSFKGVSAGDARQLVSCIYGVDVITGLRPSIGLFLAEDGPLCRSQACEEAKKLGIKILSVKDFLRETSNEII